MFTDLPAPIAARMRELEELDERDRMNDTPQLERLRQIPPETGRLLAILCASAPEGRVLEIGTSAGYSGLWLSLACRVTGRALTTYEILDAKLALARETFAKAGVEDVVDLVAGDFLASAADLGDVGFCFLDAEKDVYEAAYAAVVPQLVTGGFLVADNVISHQSTLQPLVDAAYADPCVDAVVVPIGKGELVCRRI